MRLTLILVFTTLGIVAKANPKPDLLTVKAQVAVKVKLGSKVFLPHDLPGKTWGKHSSRNYFQCMSAAYWSTTDEQIVGQVGAEGDRVYSYCARTNTSAGPPPYTQGGPGNWNTGNYVRALVKNSNSRNAKLVIKVVRTDKCIRNSTECSCKTLLDRVISSFRTVAKIEINQFIANPKLAGCRCYLGNAARYGFKSVELKNCSKKDRVVKFDENNYVTQCKIIVARDCAYYSDWLITKKKECVSCAK